MSYTTTAENINIEYVQKKIDGVPIVNDGINYRGDQMTVLGIFTSSEESIIDGFIPGGQLDYAKRNKLLDISSNTIKLVNDGFTHSSINFPLVLDTRSNYIGIQVFGGFPFKIQSRDKDDVLVIPDQASYNLFITDGLSRYRYIKDGESDLIISIRDATTIAGVNSIVDGRS